MSDIIKNLKCQNVIKQYAPEWMEPVEVVDFAKKVIKKNGKGKCRITIPPAELEVW